MEYQLQYTMQSKISIEDLADEFPNLRKELFQERQDKMELHDINENGEAIRDKLNHLNANATGTKLNVLLPKITSFPISSMLLRARSGELTQVYRLDHAAEIIVCKLNVSSMCRSVTIKILDL